MKNRSYAAPVILIGLGAIFLLNNIKPDIPVWTLLSNYWPVLLIIFGVIRLLEVLATYRGGTAAAASFRPMGFGWIPVVVVVGLGLSILGHFHNGLSHWGPIRAVNGVQLFGEEFDYPITETVPAGIAKRLVLDNLRGNITVTGGNGVDIHIDGHKIIRAFDKSDADKASAQAGVTFSPEGDAIYVRTNQDSSKDHSQISEDLEITVPKGLNVEARGRAGDLTINQIDGAVDVSSQRGEVRLQDVGGNAKLDVEHSDLVRATNLKGTLDLQGNGRDIQLDNVNGQVTINGRFSGSLDFRNLAKPLHFESEQTDLRVEKLPGSINMDLGDLRAENLVGPVRLVTHSRDVHLDDFSGPVDIDLGHGDIDLKPAAGKLARMDVRSRQGNIEMALPSDADFDLRAATEQGEVSNDFGDGVVSDTQGRAATLKSAKASGPAIVLNTARGEVSVRKLE